MRLDFMGPGGHTGIMKRLVVLGLLALSSLNAQESLTIEAVAVTRKYWPREVTVNVPHQVPIIVNGKPSGMMQAPAGRTYPVKLITAETVQVDAHGAPLAFAVADTDILARSEQTKTRVDTLAATAASAPAPVQQPVVSAPKPAATPPPTNTVSSGLVGDLVALDGRKLRKFDAAMLGGKKYFAVYRSASWCGPCRKFTPDFVSWYKSNASKHDLFEVIFVSSDRTENDMEAYMVEDKMPWPALDFSKKGKRSPIQGLGGRGIPDLILIDADGKVLSTSYEGDDYVGPRKVLRDLEELLKKS